MGFGYLGGLAIYAVSSPVMAIVTLILLLMLFFVDKLLGTSLAALCLSNMSYFTRAFLVASPTCLVILFYLLARWFLYRAQRWIADRERTRHWHDEPIYRRSRAAG